MFIYICVYLCLYACVYMCIQLYICVYICIQLLVAGGDRSGLTCSRVVRTYLYMHIYIYICIYIFKRICIYIYMCVCMCVYICIYICACIYVYVARRRRRPRWSYMQPSGTIYIDISMYRQLDRQIYIYSNMYVHMFVAGGDRAGLTCSRVVRTCLSMHMYIYI